MKFKYYGAIRIALIYAVISAIWILVSDLLAAMFFSGNALVRVSLIKGWFFVVITSILLYILVQNLVERILNTEAQASLVFNSVNDGIFIFKIRKDGTLGEFIDANQAAMKRLGYSLDDFRLMTPLQLVKRESLPETLSAFQRIIKGESVVFETVHVSADGKEIPVEISGRMIIIDDERIGATIVRDITERKLEEEERRQVALASERDKRRFYRETILAVTDGKFELTEPEEASKWIENPQFSARISGPEDLAQIRQNIISFCISKGLSEENAYEFELGIGEVLANAVKHAKGGDVYAGAKDDIVWVAIVDHGTGIDTFTLPKVALLLGFSTKASMGLGYTMILAVSDHVKLATGPGGTTVLMEKRLTPVGDLDRRIAVHQGIK